MPRGRTLAFARWARLAMFGGALAGAPLLKTILVLPLIAAAGLALPTWLVYIPAARHGALRLSQPGVSAGWPPGDDQNHSVTSP